MPEKYELIDYQGKLAVFHYSMVSFDKPEYLACYYVSHIPSEQYSSFLGYTIWFPGGSGNRGIIKNRYGNEMIMDLTQWEYTEISESIPKPRDGKDYTWKWSSGEWKKDYFPRCPNCRKFHNPLLNYCDSCYQCHGKQHTRKEEK